MRRAGAPPVSPSALKSSTVAAPGEVSYSPSLVKADPSLFQPTTADAETPYAWLRLITSLLIGTIGGVGMWSVVVVLPTV